MSALLRFVLLLVILVWSKHLRLPELLVFLFLVAVTLKFAVLRLYPLVYRIILLNHSSYHPY